MLFEMDIEVHKKCYLHFKCTHSRLTFTTAESALVQCFPTLFLAAHQHCAKFENPYHKGMDMVRNNSQVGRGI